MYKIKKVVKQVPTPIAEKKGTDVGQKDLVDGLNSRIEKLEQNMRKVLMYFDAKP